MQHDSQLLPCTTVVTGILLSTEMRGSNDTLHHRVMIGHDGDTTDVVALSAERLESALEGPLVPHEVRLFRPHSEHTGTPILVSATPSPFNDGLVHLPETVCPREGVVLGVKTLVAGIRTHPLRHFVEDVFQRRDVFAHFWRMPASARQHHAWPGGLAAHTLEAADDIAGHNGLTSLEHDLGVAGALLHDIGKVWAYTSDMFPNAAGLAMGHELLGLARLECELSRLESAWPDGAYVMRCLLSGHSRQRENGSLPPALMQRIRACDQRSCEREKASAGRSTSGRSWVPAAWREPVLQDEDRPF